MLIVEFAIVHIYSFLCRERLGMHAQACTTPNSCLGYSPTPFHTSCYHYTQFNVELYPTYACVTLVHLRRAFKCDLTLCRLIDDRLGWGGTFIVYLVVILRTSTCYSVLLYPSGLLLYPYLSSSFLIIYTIEVTSHANVIPIITTHMPFIV